MKYLILDNLFNGNYVYHPKSLSKFLIYYKKTKLRSLIRKLKSDISQKSDIKVITNNTKKFNLGRDIELELLTDFRIRIEKENFIEIEKKIVRKTRENLFKLFKNLLNLKIFQIEGVFIGKIIEFDILMFFNRIFGEYEILQEILKTESYEKVIFINQDYNFNNFIKLLNLKFKVISICTDPFLKKIWNFIPLFKIIFFIVRLLDTFIVLRKKLKKNKIIPKSSKNIVIYAHTKNQLQSTKNIFKYFKMKNNVTPIYYPGETFFPKKKITAFLKFLFQFRNICSKYYSEIINNLEYDSVNIGFSIKEYFDYYYFFITKIDLFNLLFNFKNFINNNKSQLVIITNNERMQGRIFAKISKLNNIPTLYIPHAAVPIQDEIITISDLDYITVPGYCDKDYLIKRGESKKNIIVAGRPSYDFFYKQNINTLNQVKDMFTNRVYKFDQNKFTILLATNPIDDKSNEVIIKSVIKVLLKLNLINNLVIKLHPGEKGYIHRNVIQNLGVDIVIVKDYNIFEIIKSCNLLLSRISTTILEAMMLGVPVIALDLNNSDPRALGGGTYQFMEDNILLKAINEESLLYHIKNFINDEINLKNYSEQLYERSKFYCFYDKNQSPLDKTVKIILDILKLQKDNIF